jgi:hypothetical protein
MPKIWVAFRKFAISRSSLGIFSSGFRLSSSLGVVYEIYAGLLTCQKLCSRVLPKVPKMSIIPPKIFGASPGKFFTLVRRRMSAEVGKIKPRENRTSDGRDLVASTILCKNEKNPKNRPSTPRNIFSLRDGGMPFGTIACPAGTHVLAGGKSATTKDDRAGGPKVPFLSFLQLWGLPKNSPPGRSTPICRQ